MANENLSQEFQQKYQHTCVLSKGAPVIIHEVHTITSGKSSAFPVTFSFLNDSKVYTEPFDTLDIDTSFPTLGLVNCPESGQAIFVGRQAAKQYRKGLCSNTLSVLNLSKHFLSTLPDKVLGIGVPSKIFTYSLTDKLWHSIYIQLYKKSYPTFSEALKLIGTFKNNEKQLVLSKAFDRKWAVTPSYNPDYQFILYRETYPIGFINQTMLSDMVYVTELFYQEWFDYCKRNGLKNVRIKTI